MAFDFKIFRDSSQRLLEGLPPYQTTSAANLNPPIAIYGFVPFARLPVSEGYWIWVGISTAFCLAALAVLWCQFSNKRGLLMLLWTFALPGFWQTLQLGQVYMPLIFCAALGFVLIARNERLILAGLMIGVLIAVKPNFAIWPLFLWFAGGRKTTLSAIGTAALLSLMPLVVSGPHIYQDYARTLAHVGTDGTNGNSSLAALFARYGLPDLHLEIAFAILGPTTLLLWRTRASTIEASIVALPAILLISPVAWAGYIPFMLPVMFGRRWRRPEYIAAGLMVVPLYLALDPALATTWGAAYSAALLIVLLATLYPVMRRLWGTAQDAAVPSREGVLTSLPT